MVSSIRQKLAALVISLALLVISLPAPAFALLDPPKPIVPAIQTVTDGIRTPSGVAVDATDGSIFVADPVKRGVIQFNKYGKPTMFFKTEGVPTRVAVARNGNGSVVVAQGGFVAQYNNNGVESFRLKQGADLFPFKFASAVAVHPANGNIYVADAGANRICVFDPNGNSTGLCFGDNWIEGIDYKGDPIYHKLELPMDIQISSEINGGVETNRVFVVDAKPTGLQIPIFSATGVYEKSLCGSGAGAGLNGVCQLTLPLGVTFDYSSSGIGRLYVTDPYQASVMAVDPAPVPGSPGVYGNFLSYIGSYGYKKGDLVVPTGVAFDRQHSRLIVSNGYGNITFYPIDRVRTPSTTDSTAPGYDIDRLTANNISKPTFTVTGTREADEVKVQVSVNTGAAVASTQYPTATTWNCTISDLAEGRNTIYATGRDGAGNTLTKSIDLYYTIPQAAGFFIDGHPDLTASTAYTFTGQMAAGATVTTEPAATGGCSYPTTTTWSCTVPLLVEGVNTINFVVNSVTTPTKITRDTLAPVVQVYALGTGDSTRTQVQNLVGTVNDPNLDVVTVKVNDNAAQQVAVTRNVFGFPSTKGVFNIPVILDRAGANTIVVEAKDTVNNTVSDTRSISLNLAVPSVTVDLEDGKVTRSASVMVKGTVEPAASCTINGTLFDLNGTSVSLVAGFNNIVVACSDGVRTSKVKRTVFFDPSVLELAVVAPKQDVVTNASSVTMTGSVDLATDQLVLKTNNETRNLTLYNGEFSFTAPLLTEGVHSFTLTAFDGIGNTTSTTTRSIVADMTPPAVGVSYGSTNAASVSGTVEPGATVAVKNFEDQTVGTVTIGDADGYGTFTANLGQNYDLFSLIVAATDQAGNVTTIGAAKPDGDCAANGSVSPEDASLCLDMVAGIADQTLLRRAHCDIGPLSSNVISPNGQIDITDCILIMRRAAGLPPVWW